MSDTYPNPDLVSAGYQPKMVYNTYTVVKHSAVASWAGVGGRTLFGLCEYQGELWLSGGIQGPTTAPTLMSDVWRSADGVTWTQLLVPAPILPPLAGHCMISYDAGGGPVIMFLGGSLDLAFSVFNGTLFLCDPSTGWASVFVGGILERAGHNCAVWDSGDGNGLCAWIMRGFNGTFLDDVIQTDFNLVGAQTAFLGNGAGFGVSTVFNNDLWLGLGVSDLATAGTYGTNMWRTRYGPTGGTQWEIDTPLSRYPFNAFGGSIAVFDGHLFLYRSQGILSSRGLWSSPDGVVWTQMITPNPENTVVFGHLVSWGGKLLLIGSAYEDMALTGGLQDIAEITPTKGPARTLEGFYIYEKP